MILDSMKISDGDIDDLSIPVEGTNEPGSIRTRNGNIESRIPGQGWSPLPVVMPFDPQGDEPVGFYEAEDAQSIVGAQFVNSFSGYSGTGFIDFLASTDAHVEWTFQSLAAGPFDLIFRYAIDDRALDLIVNNEVVTRMSLSTFSSGVTDWTTETYRANLRVGVNTVKVKATGWSGPNLDRMEIRAVDGAVYET